MPKIMANIHIQEIDTSMSSKFVSSKSVQF